MIGVGGGVGGSEPFGRTPAPGTAFGAICELDCSTSSMRFISSAVGGLYGTPPLFSLTKKNQYTPPPTSAMSTNVSIFFIWIKYSAQNSNSQILDFLY